MLKGARSAVSAIVVLLAHQATAQVPVIVRGATNDEVGKRLIFALRESIANSKQFAAPATTTTNHMIISVVTNDGDERGLSTSYSTVYMWSITTEPAPYFLTHQVGICGMNKVRSCAEGFTAEAIDQYEKRVK